MDISIERLCIENGLKMTGPRRVIARVLSESTVRLLEAKGILERRDLGSRRARYEPSGEKNHFHLVDQDSGKVLEFAAPDAELLLRDIARQHGFDLALIKIELFGRRPVDKMGADEAMSGDPMASQPHVQGT